MAVNELVKVTFHVDGSQKMIKAFKNEMFNSKE